MLKGLIDPAKEVEKLNKKKAALQQTVEKLQKVFRKIFFYRLFHKIFSGNSLILRNKTSNSYFSEIFLVILRVHNPASPRQWRDPPSGARENCVKQENAD